MGLELTTVTLRVRRATHCATPPLCHASIFTFQGNRTGVIFIPCVFKFYHII